MSVRSFMTVSMAALALAGCGGGGGGGSSAPPPPAAVAPPPAPLPAPPPPPPPVTGQVGLTQQASFESYAWSAHYSQRRDNSDPQPVVTTDPPDRIEIAYSAADQGYDLTLPGVPRGRLIADFPAREFNVFRLSWIGAPHVSVTLYRPGAANQELALLHTSLGYWSGSRVSAADANRIEIVQGDFVYGVATASQDVPVAGSATYSGVIYGGGIGYVSGRVTLSVDFATGIISGGIDPGINDGIGGIAFPGRYDFTVAGLGTGRNIFSGRLSGRCAAADDFFEGRFTGPRAEELMVRWRATLYDPHNLRCQTYTGIWVAQRG